MGRGQLTDEIKEKAKKLLGDGNFTVRKLRLMPYLYTSMIDFQKIDYNKINQEERKILSEWKDKGFIAGGAGGFMVTKEFFDAIHEILWLGYVYYD